LDRRAPSSEFLFDCAFLGVRSRAGPITDSRECADLLKLAFVQEEEEQQQVAPGTSYVQFTLRDVALCPDCWLVGGKGGVIFSVRHVENLKLISSSSSSPDVVVAVAEEDACRDAF
jgi:hypothetical protein